MAQANSGEFLSPECRLAFADSLFEARKMPGSEDAKFGCTLILPEAARAALMAPIMKVLHIKWGDKGKPDFDKGLIKNPIFLGTGPQAHSKQSGELWAGFGPGLIFIRVNANDDAPPRVLYRSRHIDATKEEVYSGCYGHAVLNAYTWEHPTGGRGVSFGIRSFQKTKDGESLGGRAPLDVDKWYVEIPDEPTQGKGDGATVNIFE